MDENQRKEMVAKRKKAFAEAQRSMWMSCYFVSNAGVDLAEYRARESKDNIDNAALHLERAQKFLSELIEL